MKNVISTILLLSFSFLISQETYVPMRVKDKFGLVNLKGKTVLNPQYDALMYMGKNYFSYTHNHFTKDTIHWVGGRIEVKEVNRPETGVIQHKKVIISGQKYPVYTVLPDQIILGGDSRSYIENAMLFSPNGKALFSRDIDTFHGFNPQFDTQGNMTHNLLMIAYEDKTYEIAVYDVKKGEISQRILENLNLLKVRSQRDDQLLEFDYSDKNNYYLNGFIWFENGKYQLSDERPNSFTNEQEYGMYGMPGRTAVAAPEMVPNVAMEGMKSPVPAEKMPAERVPAPISRPAPPAEFSLSPEKQVLNNKEPIEKNHLNFEFIDEKKSQKEPLIFTAENGKKGLFFTDLRKENPEFDHLQYIKNQFGITIYDFRHYYLAGKKDSNAKMKYGILKPDGTWTVPMVYDSIQVNMPETYWNTDDEKNKKIELREPYTYDNKTKRILEYSSSGFLDSNKGFMVAYQNGKAGLIGMNNEIYLPFEYENIFKNGFSFVRDHNYEMQDSFIILKKNKHYGIVEFSSNREIQKIIQPVFPELPTRYFPNYNGHQGLDMFVLSTADEITFCYADGNGKVFLKK